MMNIKWMKKERGDKDNNRGDYTRVNTTFINLVLFMNDIHR